MTIKQKADVLVSMLIFAVKNKRGKVSLDVISRFGCGVLLNSAKRKEQNVN